MFRWRNFAIAHSRTTARQHLVQISQVVLRLCRLPCGKPLAFLSSPRMRGGFASGGKAAKTVAGLTESQRLSTREAAQPQAFQIFISSTRLHRVLYAEITPDAKIIQQ